jgi:hypothetical protein
MPASVNAEHQGVHIGTSAISYVPRYLHTVYSCSMRYMDGEQAKEEYLEIHLEYRQKVTPPITWSMTMMLETVGTWLVLADHYLLSSVSARSPGPRTADRIEGRLPSPILPSTFATVGTLATARPPRSAIAGGRARGLPSYTLLGWRMRTRRPHSHERAPTTRKSYLVIAR